MHFHKVQIHFFNNKNLKKNNNLVVKDQKKRKELLINILKMEIINISFKITIFNKQTLNRELVNNMEMQQNLYVQLLDV